MAAHSAGARALLCQLSRPRECCLCFADYESRSRPYRFAVWPRRRNSLLRLYLFSDSTESHPRARRGATLDLLDTADLGRALRRQLADTRADQSLHPALCLGRRRGGALSRHHLLSHLVVPARLSRPHGGEFSHRSTACIRHWLAAVGASASARRRRFTPWLAMAFPARRLAGVSARIRHLETSSGHSRPCALV